MERSRKCKRLRLAWPEFMRLFAQGAVHAFRVLEGLPEDTIPINATYDASTNRVTLHVNSETFPEVKEGEVPPTLDIVLGSLS